MDIWGLVAFLFCYCKQCCYEHCLSRSDDAWSCGVALHLDKILPNDVLPWLCQFARSQHYVSYRSVTCCPTHLHFRLFNFAHLVGIKWCAVVVSSKKTTVTFLHNVFFFSGCFMKGFLIFKQFDYGELGVVFFMFCWDFLPAVLCFSSNLGKCWLLFLQFFFFLFLPFSCIFISGLLQLHVKPL